MWQFHWLTEVEWHWYVSVTLQWRHNERDDVSYPWPHDCLLNGLFKAQIKENIKAPRHWPLWGEFTCDRWIPGTKGQWRGKCFHLMTSSLNILVNWFRYWPAVGCNGLKRRRRYHDKGPGNGRHGDTLYYNGSKDALAMNSNEYASSGVTKLRMPAESQPSKHWRMNKMVDRLQTIISYVFPWKIVFLFDSNFKVCF